MVVITVALLIWYVYPAYTNGTDGVKEKYVLLKAEQEKLDALLEKKASADALFAQLETLGEKEVLYKFIPENSTEEEIIDNLNFNVSNSIITMFNVSIDRAVAKSELVALDEELEEGGGVVDASASSQPLPESEKMEVSANLTGEYEKVKNFILVQEKNIRFNDFSRVNIAKTQSSVEQGSSNVLMVSLDMGFQSLQKTKLSVSNVGNFTSAEGVLDSGIIEKIKERRNGPNLQLNVEQKGKANPFAL